VLAAMVAGSFIVGMLFCIANVKCQQFLGVALALNSYTSVSYGFGNE
jgi:hypothetical protein